MQNILTKENKNIIITKLVTHNLIAATDDIILRPCHNVIIDGKCQSHFEATSVESGTKFFVKALKEHDNLLFCSDYLRSFISNDGNYAYQVVLVEPFYVGELQYFITTFNEGKTLGELSNRLSDKQYKEICLGIENRFKELASIHADQYSENDSFVSAGCAEILISKLKRRLEHPMSRHYPQVEIAQIVNNFNKILTNATYSIPTLLHMDIKPDNILYNEKNGSVYLLDFELARFGDIDFGKTQLLLSGYHGYDSSYINKVWKNFINEEFNMKNVLTDTKYLCYLFYQSLCNLIFYDSRNMICPEPMKQVFNETYKLLLEINL